MRSIEVFIFIGIDDGILYYSCSLMENCDYYSNKSEYEKCLDDFYFLRKQFDKYMSMCNFKFK